MQTFFYGSVILVLTLFLGMGMALYAEYKNKMTYSPLDRAMVRCVVVSIVLATLAYFAMTLAQEVSQANPMSFLLDVGAAERGSSAP